MTPEQRLWQTVVFNAVIDAHREPNPKTEDGRAAVEARRWLKYGGRDFREVCSLAGMDPDFIREKYLAGEIDIQLLRRKTFAMEAAE